VKLTLEEQATLDASADEVDALSDLVSEAIEDGTAQDDVSLGDIALVLSIAVARLANIEGVLLALVKQGIEEEPPTSVPESDGYGPGHWGFGGAA
jgi:hypothetical protein